MPRPLPALTLGLGMLLTAATAQAATTVTIWSWTPVAPTMKEMIAQIEKAHPDIHVEATIQPHPAYSTALKAAQASGTMPDLVGLPAGAETQAYRSRPATTRRCRRCLLGRRLAEELRPRAAHPGPSRQSQG